MAREVSEGYVLVDKNRYPNGDYSYTYESTERSLMFFGYAGKRKNKDGLGVNTVVYTDYALEVHALYGEKILSIFEPYCNEDWLIKHPCASVIIVFSLGEGEFRVTADINGMNLNASDIETYIRDAINTSIEESDGSGPVHEQIIVPDVL